MIATPEYELKQADQLDLFCDHLPHKPYYADDLRCGLRIASKAHALKARHIQPNPPEHKYWLVFDVDRRGACDDWRWLDVPMPNIVATNPANGHAHLFYSISIPIRTAPDGSIKALRFAAAVENALCKALGADLCYSGLIAKNPMHSDWDVMTYQSWCYDLAWLAEYLNLSEYNDRRKKLPDYGLGRNCNTFDAVRKWAYKAIRKHDGDYNAWFEKCLQRSMAYNQMHHSIPLELNEQRHIAKSVAAWTWQRMRSYADFLDWCREKGRRGGKGKGWAYAEKREQAKAMADSGASNAQIAKSLGISERTAINWHKAHSQTQHMTVESLNACQAGARGGRAKGAAYADKREQAKAMADSGASNAQIAKSLGISKRTVINWSKE